MPTSENYETSSNKFKCPSNKEVVIHHHCPLTHCPFHVSNLESLFNLDTPTQCSLMELELQGSPSLANLQKSSLKKVSATTMRTVYNQAIEIIKTKIALINEVPEKYEKACAVCGRTDKHDDQYCNYNRKWVGKILTFYGLKPNQFRRALVWQLFSENKLFIPKKMGERK